MLGGMRGALSIALAVSIPAVAITGAEESQLTTLVLGVAFISISIQAALLYRYIKRRFPAEQRATVESLNARLSKSALATKSLEKLHAEGGISDEEFAVQLEKDRDELRDLMKEINNNLDPRSIVRQRGTELYSSLLTNPVFRTRSFFRVEKESKDKKSQDNVG